MINVKIMSMRADKMNNMESKHVVLLFQEEEIMKQLLTVDEVMDLCRVKQAKAYKIMKEINEEMQEKGFIVIRGRVNSKRLFKKLGLNPDEDFD